MSAILIKLAKNIYLLGLGVRKSLMQVIFLSL